MWELLFHNDPAVNLLLEEVGYNPGTPSMKSNDAQEKYKYNSMMRFPPRYLQQAQILGR